MNEREKVIKGLECCLPMTTRKGLADCKQCPYDRKITLEGGVTECCHDLMADAIALLKEQKPMTEQEHKDLEILRKVRSGAILKSLSHDCVIYNGNWYRKHPWNQPRETRVLSLEEYRAIAERPLEERVPVWLEWRGGSGRWTIPERAYQGYGVNWRCWTGKPSNEQRRAETWT